MYEIVLSQGALSGKGQRYYHTRHNRALVDHLLHCEHDSYGIWRQYGQVRLLSMDLAKAARHPIGGPRPKRQRMQQPVIKALASHGGKLFSISRSSILYPPRDWQMLRAKVAHLREFMTQAGSGQSLLPVPISILGVMHPEAYSAILLITSGITSGIVSVSGFRSERRCFPNRASLGNSNQPASFCFASARCSRTAGSRWSKTCLLSLLTEPQPRKGKFGGFIPRVLSEGRNLHLLGMRAFRRAMLTLTTRSMAWVRCIWSKIG